MKSSKFLFKIQDLFNGKFLLLCLVLAGFLIRIWQINSYPPLLWDEAALGYNAYSVLQTGKDEYGRFLPIIFKSFGDYKPGLYVYLAAPFVAVLGLTEWAVRLPAVIFGVLTIPALYLLVNQVFDNKKLAFFSAAALAFMPWHIHFSRGAWEANVMVFFLVFASWLWLKKRLNLSLLVFFLAMLTYQGAKMMVPFTLIGLAAFFDKFQIPYLKLKWLIRFAVWGLLFGVFYLYSFSGPAKNRLRVMSLSSYRRPASEIKMVLKEDGLKAKNGHFYLFHGEWLSFSRGVALRYFNHFSPRFLAFEGDWNSPRHSAPYFGMIGRVGFVLFLFGLGGFLFKKHRAREYFFLYWLLVAPLPAALSRDIVSGVRALPMTIPLAVFIAYGVWLIVDSKFKITKPIVVFLLLTAFLFDFASWGDLYFVHMVQRRPKDWLYGYKETVNKVIKDESGFNKIIFSDFYGQPYIYYLFYSRYPPKKYQAKAHLTENPFGDVGRVEKIGKIAFKPINWSAESKESSMMMIISDDEVLRAGLENKNIFSRFLPLGKTRSGATFYLYENN